MMTILAAQETPRGWGGPIAILIAVALFCAGVWVHQRLQEAARRRPSPTRRGHPRRGVNSQVGVVSDTDDTTADPNPWWGRIVDVGGHRVRQARQIWRTGAVRDDEPDDELADDEIDLALDDESLEEFVDRADRQGIPYAEIVRDAMRLYRVSESTAKRRIREVRAERLAAKRRAG